MIATLKSYPVYKDSGVEWLGKVPESWDVRRLKQVCSRSALYGANIASSRYVAKGIRFLRTTDVRDDGSLKSGGIFVTSDDASGYLLAEGDLLVSRSGTIGRSFLYSLRDHGECAYAGYLVRFVPGCDVLPKFLFSFTKSSAFDGFLNASAIHSTIVNVNGEKYGRAPLAVPSLPEQASIVRFLDHVDSRIQRLIKAKNRLIELLEEEKQAIIHHAVIRGLDPDVPLKPSGVDWLGDVPGHWEILDLGRFIDLLPGFAFPSGGFSSQAGDTRLLRGVNIAPGEVRWDEVVRWPEDQQDCLGRYQLEIGDLVLGLDRPIISTGIRIARVTEKDTPSLLLQRVARIRTLPGLLSDFAYLLLGGEVFRSYMTPIFTGISVPHLSPEQVKKFRIGLPPLGEQEDIVGRVSEDTERVDAAVAAGQRHITLLCEFRTRLISDVVTGKLDVRKVAERLPDDPGVADRTLDEQLEKVIA